MSDIVDIGYNLDASGYRAGVSAVEQANRSLIASTQQVTQQQNALQRAWGTVTPARAAAAGLVAVSASAATAEQRYAGLEARWNTAGQSADKMRGSIQGLARDVPIGQRGAIEISETISSIGVSGQGSEKQVASLGKTIANLAGANAVAPREMAKGMLELSKATGNSNLDPRRVQALGDSLTTVTAQMGAGTQAAMQYATQLSPMAKEMNLGATAVTGMGSAFAAMGDQGVGAANTVQSLMTGIGRAVRDGGPELRQYAEMAGMTADSFERLVKADPADALSRITTNVAGSGAQGQRMLETVGIEGVGGQQQFKQLAAQGGLQAAVDAATASYGGGGTDRAAKDAYDGLTNELTRTKEASGQLAEAMGRPLLGPLEGFASVMGGITSLLATVTGSTAGQVALSAGGIGAVGLMAGKRIAGPLLGYSFARQMATSGVVRAGMAGYAQARGLTPEDSRIARWGAPIAGHVAAGTLLRDNEGRPTDRAGASFYSKRMDDARQFGAGLAKGMPERTPGGAGFTGMRGTAMGYGLMGTSLLANASLMQVRDAFEPDPHKRTRGIAPYLGPVGVGAARAWESASAQSREAGKGRFRSAWAGARAYNEHVSGAGPVGPYGLRQPLSMPGQSPLGKDATEPAQAAMRRFSKQLDDTGKATARVGSTFSTLAATTAHAFGSRGAGGRVASLGKSAVGGALAGAAAIGLTGPGLAVMGLMGAGAIGLNEYQKRQEEKEYLGSFSQQDIYGSINRYREASGMAAQAVSSEQLNQEASAGLAQRATIQGFDATRQVTSSDQIVASGGNKKPIVKYYGKDPREIAGQIVATNQQGVTAEELSAIKGDLINQFGPNTAQEILSLLPPEIEKGKGQLSGYRLGNQQRSALEGLSNDTSAQTFGGWGDTLKDLTGFGSKYNEEGKKSAHELVKGIDAWAKEKGGTAEYQIQERQRGYNRLLNEAVEMGDMELANELAKAIASNLDPKMKGKNWYEGMLPKELESYTGDDPMSIIAKESTVIQEQRGGAAKKGGTFDPAAPGGISYTAADAPNVQTIAGVSGFLGEIFSSATIPAADSRTGYRPGRAAMVQAQESTQAAIEAGPGDIAARQRAYLDLKNAAEATGRSITQLGNSAQAASRDLPEGMEKGMMQYNSMMARREEDLQLMLEGDPTAQRRARIDRLAHDIGLPALTPEEEQQQLADIDALQAEAEGMKAQMVNRLEMQFNFDKQMLRGERDFNISRADQNEDFQISVARQEEEYQIQRGRAHRDYNIGVARAERDFGIQRERQIIQFNIGVQRAERDYGIQRARAHEEHEIQVYRATRDYGIQRSRAYEDFGIAMVRAEREYGIQRKRAVEDYTIQTARAIQDFTISTRRATRDFGISLRRQLEDAAKNIFDPYSRVQAKPTWDAATLTGNLAEQREMMEQQAKDLARLRKGGLSEDAIRNLDLANFDNAQQVANLVADMSPKIINQLNKEMSKRDTASQELYQDKSNTNLKRQREDFNRSQRDQRDDFNKSMRRSADDFNRSMDRSADDFSRNMRDSREDFTRSMRRMSDDFRRSMRDSTADFRRGMRNMAADFRRSMRDSAADFRRGMRNMAADFKRSMRDQRADFNRSMKWQYADFKKSLRDQAADFNRAMADQKDNFSRSLRNQREDFNRSQARQMRNFRIQVRDMKKDLTDADKVISGSFKELAKQTSRAMTGKTVDYSKIMKSDTRAITKDVRGILGELKAAYGEIGITDLDLSDGNKKKGGKKPRGVDMGTWKSRAEGGFIDGYSPHDKADNIPTLLTAGEYVQPVARVKQYGLDAMEAVRKGTATIVDQAGRVFGGMKSSAKKIESQKLATGGIVALGKSLQKQGYHVSEHPRFGGVAPGAHSATGWHYKGGALDINADSWNSNFASEYHALERLNRRLRKQGWNTIWQAAGHYDHLHVDIGNGQHGGIGFGPDLDKMFKKINKERANRHPIYGAIADHAYDVLSKKIEEDFGGSGGVLNVGSGVQRWAGLVRKALRITGSPQSLLSSTLRRMQQESGGDPNAVNRWDSNWRAGTPSVGLMQVIGPTYRAYRHPSYNRQPFMYGASIDPLSNVLASMRYAKSVYGSLSRAYDRAGGYADGGLVRAGLYDAGGKVHPGRTMVDNRSGKPEALLSNDQWSDISQLAALAGQMLTKSDLKMVSSSRGVPITVNHNNQRITYDSRNDFGGANFTVVSQDPDEMARKLERKETLARLTDTRGVRRP